MEKNVKAFLDTLAISEGTPRYGDMDGYNVIVGGNLFDSYHDHPRKLVHLPRYGIKSSAAGRYQIIRTTWDALAKRLKLKDFSPSSQDKAAIELLRECGALVHIHSGQFDKAVHAARKIWASLPGAGYGQRENSLAGLRQVFIERGGRIA